MAEQFANKAQTTLNGSITNSASSLTVTSATGFPTSGEFRIFIKAEGANTDEICTVTAVSGTTFTVTRASEAIGGTQSASAHASGAEVIHVLTAGAINRLASGQGFIGARVYNNAAQPANSGEYTLITFNSERFDTDGFHSTSVNTGRLTVPAGLGGYYLIGASAIWSAENSSGQRLLRFKVNGSTVHRVGDTSASQAIINDAFPRYLNAGDYVELEQYQDSTNNSVGVSYNTNEESPEFWVLKLDSGSIGQGIGATVHNAATQSATSSQENYLTFDTEDFDTDGFHNIGSDTSRLTIPTGLSGKYLIIGSTYSVTNVGWDFRIIKNRTTKYADVHVVAAAGNAISTSAILDLAAGDYVELSVYPADTASMGHATEREAQSNFSIMRLDSGSSNLVVQEVDGSPSAPVKKIIFPNNTTAIADGIATITGFKLYTFTVGSGATAYIPDADIPRGGSAIITDSPGGNSGAAIIQWYRHGTFNSINGVATGNHGYEFRNTTYSGGNTGFSFFIENNDAGGRLGCKNNNGSYGRDFILFIIG